MLSGSERENKLSIVSSGQEDGILESNNFFIRPTIPKFRKYNYIDIYEILTGAVEAHEEALKAYKIAQLQIACEAKAEEKKHDEILKKIKECKEPVVSDLRKQELEKEKKLDELEIAHQVLNLVGKYIDDSFFIDNFADGLFTLREIIFDKEQIEKVQDSQSALYTVITQTKVEAFEAYNTNVLFYMVYLIKNKKHPNMLTLLSKYLPRLCKLGLDIETLGEGHWLNYLIEPERTILAIAMSFNMPAVVEILLENGADPLCKVSTARMKTPPTIVQMSFFQPHHRYCKAEMKLLLFSHAVKLELKKLYVDCLKYKNLIFDECKAFTDDFDKCYGVVPFAHKSNDYIAAYVKKKIEEVIMFLQEEISRLEKEENAAKSLV